MKLINHAFEKTNIIRIKAITQADNKKTIHINMKLGFKRDKEETIWARLFGILKNLFS